MLPVVGAREWSPRQAKGKREEYFRFLFVRLVDRGLGEIGCCVRNRFDGGSCLAGWAGWRSFPFNLLPFRFRRGWTRGNPGASQLCCSLGVKNWRNDRRPSPVEQIRGVSCHSHLNWKKLVPVVPGGRDPGAQCPRIHRGKDSRLSPRGKEGNSAIVRSERMKEKAAEGKRTHTLLSSPLGTGGGRKKKEHGILSPNRERGERLRRLPPGLQETGHKERPITLFRDKRRKRRLPLEPAREKRPSGHQFER